MGDSGTVTLGQPFFQDATPGGGGVLTSAGPGGVPWWIWLMGGVLAFQMSALVGWIFVLAMLLTMLGPGLQSINNFAMTISGGNMGLPGVLLLAALVLLAARILKI